MIERIIDRCAPNRFLVFTGTVVLTASGIWAMTQTPLDAVPDISDVQVIISTERIGCSPDLLEDPKLLPSKPVSPPRIIPDASSVCAGRSPLGQTRRGSEGL